MSKVRAGLAAPDFKLGHYRKTSYASPPEFERLHAAVPVDAARAVGALQAPTSQVEIGLPVTTHTVTGKAATGPNGNPTRTGPRERAWARSNQDRKELRSRSSGTSQPNGQLDRNEHKAHAAVQPRRMGCGTEWSDSTLEPANYRSTNRLQAHPARTGTVVAVHLWVHWRVLCQAVYPLCRPAGCAAYGLAYASCSDSTSTTRSRRCATWPAVNRSLLRFQKPRQQILVWPSWWQTR